MMFLITVSHNTPIPAVQSIVGNISAMSSGGFGTTHLKFSTNETRKQKTPKKH